MIRTPAEVTNVGDAQLWVAYVTGAAAGCCLAQGNGSSRSARSQWASNSLHALLPAMMAAFDVAAKYPDEFRAALGAPVKVEPMP